jgi:DNA-3-methyladenine glycosylase
MTRRRTTDGRFQPLPSEFFSRDAREVAIDLLGRYLVRQLPKPLGGQRMVARIVETEAYLGEGDAASHARNGPATARSKRLYRPGGQAYVYLIYGMHFCFNVVTGSREDGGAVLVRGAAPIERLERMVELRNRVGKNLRPGDIAGGPGKLCQALAIDDSIDGRPLDETPLYLAQGEPIADTDIARGPRIGVDYAGEAAQWPLRFGIAGHPEMSRPILRSR